MKKVFVGLSGGVDSAVSAALLKDQGYDVTGVFIKVWQPSFAPCTWRAERRDAMRAAIALDIPFLFLDFEEEYKKGVADDMIEEYRKGRTPNPDILCNREIKFGAFWKKAKELGADYMATGHYARVSSNASLEKPSDVSSGKHGQTISQNASDSTYHLLEGRDKEKDQSYFLWTLTQEDLAHTLFPIGHLEKKEVRELAKKFNIPVAEKKDSQGICFIGEVSMDEFLAHYIESVPGEVLNVAGEVVGRHRGSLFYTIGERHGFEILKKAPDAKPYYVVAKDMEGNTITVSNVESEIEELSPNKFSLTNINWTCLPVGEVNKPEGELTARMRYRGKKIPVKIEGETVELLEKEAGVSLGQSIVFYQGEECLGGAVLDEALL
jgi:tRNA-specific 2-thiouridylase